jgi:flagellar biosynthesis/type III secretory pathway chaperone
MEILSEEEKRSILEALHKADELRRELERARRAGLDVSDLEQRLQEAVQQLTQLRRVYITGR